MRRNLVLLFSGFASFAVAAAALTPASLLHALVLQPRGVEAAMVSGTVWDGRWRDLTAGGVRFADASIRLRPLSLFRGAPALAVDVSGPGGSAVGAVILSGMRVEITDVSGRVLPAAFVRADGAALAVLSEPVRFTGVQGAFGSGGCLDLSGQVSGAGLLALDAALSAQMPLLEGRLECVGGALGLPFAGASPDLALDGHVRLTPGGAGWMLRARPQADHVAGMFRSLGFSGPDSELMLEGQTVLTLRRRASP